MVFLCAAQMPAEAGNNLIENQERAIDVAKIFHFLQEIILGRFKAFYLHEETGDLVRIFFEQAFYIFDIVVVEFYSQVSDGLRDSGRHIGRPNEPVIHRKKWMIN